MVGRSERRFGVRHLRTLVPEVQGNLVHVPRQREAVASSPRFRSPEAQENVRGSGAPSRRLEVGFALDLNEGRHIAAVLVLYEPASATEALQLILVDDECGGDGDESIQVARRIRRRVGDIDDEVWM